MSTPLADPFTPGQVPRILAGRGVEMGRIRDQLGRVVAFGEVGGPLLVFHAPRGLGKTSLLRAAQRQSAELGFVSVWVSCARGRPFLPELVSSHERSFRRAEVDLTGDEGARWRTRVDRISIELGVPGIKVRGDLASTPPPPEAAGAAAPIGALEDLLHSSAALVRQRGGAGLVVFLDELHAAGADDLATLLNALQNLDGDREENPLCVVAAGLPATPEAITSAATFGERSAFVPLDVLSRADAESALRAPAAELGVSWDDRALRPVLDEARGHPYLLQLFGSATWATADRSPGGTISAAESRAGIAAAADQLDAMHRTRWRSATRGEQAFLSAMATSVLGGADNVSRATIAAALGQDTRSVSVPRERLIEKGVIEPVGRGLVRFTLPGFAAYVRRQ